jgi:hypothetical protein
MYVTYSTPPTKDLLMSKTMAIIALLKGVNLRMGTTADAVTGTNSKPWSYVCTIQPQDRTHLKQTTTLIGVIVNLRMVTTIVTSTTQCISAGPVRL